MFGSATDVKDPLKIGTPETPAQESKGILGKGWDVLVGAKNGVVAVANVAVNAANAIGSVYNEGTRQYSNYTNGTFGSDTLSRLITKSKKAIANKNPVNDEKIKERLVNLDENNKLPEFSEAISKFIVKKLEDHYQDKTGDLQVFLTYIIHKAFAHLACSKPVPANGEKGQLFTNVIEALSSLVGDMATPVKSELDDYAKLYEYSKNFLTYRDSLEDKIEDLELKKKNHLKHLGTLEENSPEKSEVEGWLESIDLQLVSYKYLWKEYESYRDEHYQKSVSDHYGSLEVEAEPFLNSEKWLDRQPVSKLPAKTPFEIDLLKKRSELFIKFHPLVKKFSEVAGLHAEEPIKYLLKLYGIESTQTYLEGFFSGLLPASLKVIPERLIDLFVDAHSELLRPEREASDTPETIPGIAEFKSDANGIATAAVAKISKKIGSETKRAEIAYDIKDLLDEKGIYGLERLWMEKLLEKCTDGSALGKSVQRFLIEAITPRMTNAVVNATGNSSGNLFQRLITTGSDVVSEFFAKAKGLPEAVCDYDRICSLSDALTWRNRYLKEQKGLLKADECDKAACGLTEQDIIEIFKMGGYDTSKITELLIGTRLFVEPDADIFKEAPAILLSFFRTSSGQKVDDRKRECLAHSFAPLGDRLLDLLGLSNDAAFALPGATGNKETSLYDLDSVRQGLLPVQLLELYREMSDLKGSKAKTEREALNLFGNEQAYHDFAKFFTGMVTSPVLSYLKDSSAEAADKFNGPNGLMPACDRMMAETIKGIAVNALRFKDEPKVISDAAIPSGKVIYDHVDELIRGCMMKIMVAFAKKSRARTGGGAESNESSKILGSIVSELGELFKRHRAFIDKKTDAYHEADKALRVVLEAGANEEIVNNLEELKSSIRKSAFAPISEELIEICGLKSRDLQLPSWCEEEVWNAITDRLPEILSTVYLDLTTWEDEHKVQAENLQEQGFEHGPGASAAISYFTVKVVQSMLAVDNKSIANSLYDSMIDFFKGAEGPDGKKLAEMLKDGSEAGNKMIQDNLSRAARNSGVKEILSIFQNYLNPVLQNTVAAIGENLKTIQENNPNILMKIAKDSLLVAGDHFKQIHAVALRENIKNAYDVNPVTLLEGITSDENVLAYVLLKEKESIIKKSLDKKRYELRESFFRSTKDRINQEIREIVKSLKSHRKEIRKYASEHWQDQGVAVERYLQAERSLKQWESALNVAEKSLKQRLKKLLPKSDDIQDVKTARHRIAEAKDRLERTKRILDTQGIQVIQNDPSGGKLKNLSLMKDYRLLKSKLQTASSEFEKEKAQAELDDYRIKNYFSPLTKKLLKLANEDQFDAIPFPSIFPKEWKSKLIHLAKNDLLPQVLNNLFQNLVKPETLQGIVLSGVKKLNESPENAESIDVSMSSAPLSQEDQDFDKVCGKMIMDLIELNASGVEKDFLSSIVKTIDVEGSAGKVLGAAMREFLSTQSLTGILDQSLESVADVLVPEGQWAVKNNFIFGVDKNPFPQTPEDVARQKSETITKNIKIENDLKVELAKLTTRKTIAQAKAFFASLSSKLMIPWNKFKSLVHATIDRLFKPEVAKNLKASFDQGSDKILAIISTVVDFFSTVILKPLLEGFVKFIYTHIGMIYVDSHVERFKKVVSMEIHERLLFQLVNIAVGTLEDELAIADNKKASATNGPV